MITLLSEWVKQIEADFYDRLAFRFYREDRDAIEEITYKEYATNIKQAARKFTEEFADKKCKNNHIGIICENTYDYMVCLIGGILAGGVIIPLNYNKSYDDTLYEIGNSNISYLICSSVFYDKYADFCHQAEIDIIELEEYKSFQQLEEFPVDDDNRLSIIMYTSGTTGKSKGVMLSQKNILADLEMYFEPFELCKKLLNNPKHIFQAFFILPIYHILGLMTAIIFGTTGNTINICSNPRNIFKEYEKLGGDYISAFPALIKMITNDLNKRNNSKLDGVRVISCSAAMISPEQMEFFIKKGIFVMQIYGMTETSGHGAFNISQSIEHCGSVGQVCLGCEVKVVDGEIYIKSKGNMKGYYNNEEATTDILVDGWIKTGDLGYVDEQGYVYLTGRKKNVMIFSGGEKVSPEELEEELKAHTPLTEVLIHQEKDSIVAEIFCDRMEEANITEYINTYNLRNPLYKRINKIRFSDKPFEKTTEGKIKRNYM